VSYVSHDLSTTQAAIRGPGRTSLLSKKIHTFCRLGLVEGASGFITSGCQAGGTCVVFGGPQQKSGSYLLDEPIKNRFGHGRQSVPAALDRSTTRQPGEAAEGLSRRGLGSKSVGHLEN